MLAFAAAFGVAAATGDPGTATVPVSELLELHRAREPVAPAPPVGAVLDAVRIEGRVLDDALELEIAVRASVLATGWTEIPVMDLGPDALIAPVEPRDHAWLAVRDGTLVLVSDAPGRYTFDVSASVHPSRSGARREAAFQVHPATSARLELRHDPELVRIEADAAPAAGTDAMVVRPRGGRYALAWVATERAAAAPVVAAERRAAEPVVERATASVVSTLEGTWLVRTHYDLRFEGRRTVSLTWPEDHHLERVWVNGAPVDAVPAGNTLELEVAPTRGGGDRGTVELVLTRDRAGYLLQGTVDLELVSVSWPVREWVCALHLPEVFDYAWAGGSMEGAKGTPEPAPDLFSYQVPTPGEVTLWHQELVFAAPPTLRLAYTVELDGVYFRPVTQ